MAFEGQSVGSDSFLSTQRFVEKNVPPASEAVPACSKNLESDTGFYNNKLDCLHEANSRTYTESSASANLKNLDSLQTLAKKNVSMADIAVTGQYTSKPNRFSTSLNTHGPPFSYVNRAPQLGYGRFSGSSARGYHTSTTMPSSSYRGDGRKFSGNSNLSTDLIRGPRANKMHFPSSAEKNEVVPLLNRDQFNRSDFQIKYEYAKFFMIKSFSEDDIHKGIKYNVWASTPYGNNKLEAAFREAEKATQENLPKCPIFLFFSVNASGQFVGLAEMIGPVDFNRTMEFWREGRWNGFFPLKWHIIKDIPNKYFQNITLENNDNKPVTFSRDTQEIGLPQGLKMLQFFKSYPLSRSILHDFDFYEQKERLQIEVQRRQQRSSQTEEHLEADFDEMSISSPYGSSYDAEY